MAYTDTVIEYREATLAFQVDTEVAEGEENAYIRTTRTDNGKTATVELPLNLAELDEIIAGLIRTRTALAIELAMQERDEQEAAKAA
jgi:hypothetical protein